jgi:hypothetical protein
MEKIEIDLELLIQVVEAIKYDDGFGDYTAIEGLFQFLDKPEKRLKEFLPDYD